MKTKSILCAGYLVLLFSFFILLNGYLKGSPLLSNLEISNPLTSGIKNSCTVVTPVFNFENKNIDSDNHKGSCSLVMK